jgi:hypothetical protein
MLAVDRLAGDVAELGGNVRKAKLEPRGLARHTEGRQRRRARVPNVAGANAEQRNAQQRKQDQDKDDFIGDSTHAHLSTSFVGRAGLGKNRSSAGNAVSSANATLAGCQFDSW